jgi:hypothetical protein
MLEGVGPLTHKWRVPHGRRQVAWTGSALLGAARRLGQQPDQGSEPNGGCCGRIWQRSGVEAHRRVMEPQGPWVECRGLVSRSIRCRVRLPHGQRLRLRTDKEEGTEEASCSAPMRRK